MKREKQIYEKITSEKLSKWQKTIKTKSNFDITNTQK